MKYAVCRVIWTSRGFNYKSVSAALQERFPGREGLAASSLHRYVKLGVEAPPDVVEAICALPMQPDGSAEGAEVVQLGLDALERGPVVDPDALAASLRAKLPAIDPDVIASVVTARLCGSDELAKKVAAEVRAQQPDAFEIAWKAAAEALAQEPRPPSADDVVAKVAEALASIPAPPSAEEIAAKVETTLARQPKTIARYVARYLGRRNAKLQEPLNAKQLGDEIAQNVSEKLQAPNVDEKKIAAAVVRGFAPWFGFGFGLAGLVAVVWLVLHYQHTRSWRVSDSEVPALDFTSESGRLHTLGQGRLPLWDWQDRPPCIEPSQELDGGCWVALEQKPPCTRGRSWEKGGKCWMPATGGKRRPPQAGDGTQAPPPAEIPR